MSVRLIYHKQGNEKPDLSPFDESILEIVKNKNIKIACPYLNMGYLERILNQCNEWQIITDIEELIKSQNNLTSRDEFLHFIITHNNKIHHCANLHAKLILSNEQAIVGSANFTNMGVTQRAELSVHFDHEPQVDELNTWYDDLWSQTDSGNINEMEAFTFSLPSPNTSEKAKTIISSPLKPINAKLVYLNTPGFEFTPSFSDIKAEDRLIETVSFTPNRVWANDYFNLIQEVIIRTGLKNDDPRLVTSLPKNNLWLLPVSINNRYVIAAQKIKNLIHIRVIFKQFPDTRPDLKVLCSDHWRFSPLPGEDFNTPFLLQLSNANDIISDPELKYGWLESSAVEVNRARKSVFRRFHQPVVYKAAVNTSYREEILEKAFKKKNCQ